MQKSEMTIQELFDYMDTHESNNFIIHVEFSEEVSDE